MSERHIIGFWGGVERDVLDLRLTDEQADRYRERMNRTAAHDLARLADARDDFTAALRSGIEGAMAKFRGPR